MIALFLRGVQEHIAHIGAVNAGVTTCTRLARRRAAMRGLACSGVERRRMALQADRVHIGMSQQFGIRSPVREVTGSASFSLDRGVLINERSGHRGVAFCAYSELPSGSVALTLSIIGVCIVAICTPDQPLCNQIGRAHV